MRVQLQSRGRRWNRTTQRGNGPKAGLGRGGRLQAVVTNSGPRISRFRLIRESISAFRRRARALGSISYKNIMLAARVLPTPKRFDGEQTPQLSILAPQTHPLPGLDYSNLPGEAEASSDPDAVCFCERARAWRRVTARTISTVMCKVKCVPPMIRFVKPRVHSFAFASISASSPHEWTVLPFAPPPTGQLFQG